MSRFFVTCPRLGATEGGFLNSARCFRDGIGLISHLRKLVQSRAVDEDGHFFTPVG